MSLVRSPWRSGGSFFTDARTDSMATLSKQYPTREYDATSPSPVGEPSRETERGVLRAAVGVREKVTVGQAPPERYRQRRDNEVGGLALPIDQPTMLRSWRCPIPAR